GDTHPGSRDCLVYRRPLGAAPGPRPPGGRPGGAHAGPLGMQPRRRLPAAGRRAAGVPADVRRGQHPPGWCRGLSSPRGSSGYALERICLGRLSHLASLSRAPGVDRRPNGRLRPRALRGASDRVGARARVARHPRSPPGGRGSRPERIATGIGAPGLGLGRALRGSGRHRARSAGEKRMTASLAARWALVVATLLTVATIALSSLTVFDFWWYLASGQRILETRSVPTTDPFSYT